MKRLSWSQTWRLLENDGFDLGERTPTGRPYRPRRMPSFDDERRSFGFFKEGLEGGDLSCLTLCRLFVGRCLLEDVNFSHSDLSHSRLCWNDFVGCRFENALLTGCDGRASVWKNCDFRGADLSGADLRGCELRECHFEGARCEQLHLTSEQGQSLELSALQRAQILWCEHEGEEPEGG